MAIPTLQMALQHRRPTPGLILHQDRDSQYTGARYRAKPEEAKIQLSISRPSMPYDNAVAESFFATLKLELLEGPAYATQDDARQAVFEYLAIFYMQVAVPTPSRKVTNPVVGKWQ